MTLKKIILTTLILFVFYPAVAQNNPLGKEVLLVEIFGTSQWNTAKFQGIFITGPDGKTEKILFGGCSDPTECITRSAPIVQKKIQEIYNSGWKLETSSGGDQYIRYVFIR